MEADYGATTPSARAGEEEATTSTATSIPGSFANNNNNNVVKKERSSSMSNTTTQAPWDAFTWTATAGLPALPSIDFLGSPPTNAPGAKRSLPLPIAPPASYSGRQHASSLPTSDYLPMGSYPPQTELGESAEGLASNNGWWHLTGSGENPSGEDAALAAARRGSEGSEYDHSLSESRPRLGHRASVSSTRSRYAAAGWSEAAPASSQLASFTTKSSPENGGAFASMLALDVALPELGASTSVPTSRGFAFSEDGYRPSAATVSTPVSSANAPPGMLVSSSLPESHLLASSSPLVASTSPLMSRQKFAAVPRGSNLATTSPSESSHPTFGALPKIGSATNGSGGPPSQAQTQPPLSFSRLHMSNRPYASSSMNAAAVGQQSTPTSEDQNSPMSEGVHGAHRASVESQQQLQQWGLQPMPHGQTETSQPSHRTPQARLRATSSPPPSGTASPPRFAQYAAASTTGGNRVPQPPMTVTGMHHVPPPPHAQTPTTTPMITGRYQKPTAATASSTGSATPSGASVPSDDPLLVEYKTTGRRPGIQDLLGHVVPFALDAHGSRFLQYQMELARDEEREALIHEVVSASVQLMQDTFGNYVIQNFFEHANPALRRVLADSMRGSMLTLSMQPHGCRVVQRALDLVDIEMRNVLLDELLVPIGNVYQAARNTHATHVLQKTVSILRRELASANHASPGYAESERLMKAVESAVADDVIPLLLHSHAYRLVLNVLGSCDETNESKGRALRTISENFEHLALDQHGNFMLQHMLEVGGTALARVHGFVVERLVDLSQHKFGSHLVEKCFSVATPQRCVELVEELLRPSSPANLESARRMRLAPLDSGAGAAAAALKGSADDSATVALALMTDPYANFVVQKALDRAPERLRSELARVVRENAETLARFTYGRHILGHVNALSVSGGVPSSPQHTMMPASGNGAHGTMTPPVMMMHGRPHMPPSQQQSIQPPFVQQQPGRGMGVMPSPPHATRFYPRAPQTPPTMMHYKHGPPAQHHHAPQQQQQAHAPHHQPHPAHSHAQQQPSYASSPLSSEESAVLMNQILEMLESLKMKLETSNPTIVLECAAQAGARQSLQECDLAQFVLLLSSNAGVNAAQRREIINWIVRPTSGAAETQTSGVTPAMGTTTATMS